MIEVPDLHYLSAAVGWTELGNTSEARAELALVSHSAREHPDVLEVLWGIAAAEKNWDEALEVAARLAQKAPDRPSGWLHRAYALRRCKGGSLQEARAALLPAWEKFPKEPTIAYNLSCYACQLGELSEARTWLKRAIKAGDKQHIKALALQDLDLKPLWKEIRTL